MSSVWMETEGFEKSTEILDAINVLSVHAKLARDGEDDITTPAEQQQSRKHLRAFLAQMSGKSFVDSMHSGEPVWGADPRLSDLAHQLASIQQAPEINGNAPGLVADILQSLDSDKPEEMERLVNSLRQLRSLVQQHAHSDVAGLFGDI